MVREDYNAQAHWAHQDRDDGRRSPAKVLDFVSGVRHCEEDLGLAFFSARFVRVLDSSGYARFPNRVSSRWTLWAGAVG